VGAKAEDKTCRSTEWYTPPEILAPVRAFFGGEIPFDPANASHNPTAARTYCTKEGYFANGKRMLPQDGLSMPWAGRWVFVNPPYGEGMRDWLAKIHEEAKTFTPIIGLLSCTYRIGTRYWAELVWPRTDAVCFVNGRVAFIDESGQKVTGNTHPSMLLGWNVPMTRFVEAFGSLGACFAQARKGGAP